MFAPAYFNQNGQDYLRHANDNILVIVQIESRKAVENCEEIAKTPGIGTFFCPCPEIRRSGNSTLRYKFPDSSRHAIHWPK